MIILNNKQTFSQINILGEKYFFKTLNPNLQTTLDNLFTYVGLMGYETKVIKKADKITYVVNDQGKTFGVHFTIDNIVPILLQSFSFYFPGQSSFCVRDEETILSRLDFMIKEL